MATLGFRYGWSIDTEIYTRLTGASSSVRSEGLHGARAESAQSINDWTVGINHRLSKDNDTPALLAFLEGTLAENIQKTVRNMSMEKVGRLDSQPTALLTPWCCH